MRWKSAVRGEGDDYGKRERPVVESVLGLPTCSPATYKPYIWMAVFQPRGTVPQARYIAGLAKQRLACLLPWPREGATAWGGIASFCYIVRMKLA